MDGIEAALHVLGLNEFPDMDKLQKTFNRLIKQCHPDIHREREQWAHERTRKLIESYSAIKDEIRQGRSSGSVYANINYEDYVCCENSYSPTVDEIYNNPFESKKIRFQLIAGRKVNYAIPLDNIVRIVSLHSGRILPSSSGPVYQFGGSCYTLIHLEDCPFSLAKTDYIILYLCENIRLGLVVTDDMKFESITDVSEKEMVPHSASKKSESGLLIYRHKHYLYPMNLFDDIATRYRYKSEERQGRETVANFS